MLIVDLRRPIQQDVFKRNLRQTLGGDVFAFSPIAAWLLEREGVQFQTSDKIVPAQWFKDEGLQTFSRLDEAFHRAFGSEKESWLGLTYELKIILDYALIEERRWLLVEEGAGHVLSDIPLTSRENLLSADHIENRAALYFWGVQPDRFIQIPRASESVSRWITRLRRVNGASIRRRLSRLCRLLPSSCGPTLVTTFGYDWEAYGPRLEKRFRAISAGQLASEALAMGQAEPAGEHEGCVGTLLNALQAQFGGILPRTLSRVLRIMASRFHRYAEVRRALARNISVLAERYDVRASLSTECSTQDDFLVNYYLKTHGYPTLFYQHGGYTSESLTDRDAEIVPATHNLVYGDADAVFFRRLCPEQSVIRVGCPALNRVAEDAGCPSRFLYVLYHNAGNSRYVHGHLDRPLTDETAVFRRHRQVIDLFAKHPRMSLHLREHPAQARDCLYEPLREYIQGRGLRNVFMDCSPGPTERYLKGYEGIILDYVSTTVLYALAMKKRVACYLGAPGGISAEGKRLLALAAACSDTDDSFVASLENWLIEGLPKTDEDARRRFLALYGGNLNARDPGAWPQLERVLGASSLPV